MLTQKVLLDQSSENWSKIKKQTTNAHNKSVARLVDSENQSKKIKITKQQHAHNKSVARLVDSENW